MDKQQEIELVEKAVRDACKYAISTTKYASGIGCVARRCECDCFCTEACVLEAMIEAGYRKADEVRKETAREILQAMNEKMNMLTGCGVPYHVKQFMKEIAEEYGVEVDE